LRERARLPEPLRARLLEPLRARLLEPLPPRPVDHVEKLARGVHLIATAALRAGGNPNLVIHYPIMPRPWPFLKEDDAEHCR
jgi:hypothetical protein